MSEELYTIGEWCGYTQYRCKECPFDVLIDDTRTAEEAEEQMYMHWLRRHHRPEPVPEPTPLGGGNILIADKSGREVGREVEPEPPKRSRRKAADVLVIESEVTTDGEIDTDGSGDGWEIPDCAPDGGRG